MKKSLFCVLSVAAVIGTALTSTAASAAVTANGPAGGDPDTTVTFTVAPTTGLLTMTAPTSADLGTGAPGSTITSSLGAVTVTDDRALLGAAWAVTASSSNFTTGGTSGPETIPVGDATYTPGTPVVTGSATAIPTDITLSATPQIIVALTGNGNNIATWNPTIAVAVPSTAVGGIYTATLVQSVTAGGS